MSLAQFERGNDFYAFIAEDFGDSDPVRKACVNIYNFIKNNPKDSLRHLTFGILREHAGLSEDDGKTLHSALSYLTGYRARLLVVGYEFIDPQTADEHELSDEETSLFLAEGRYFHPVDGVEVENPAGHIYVFFRPNYSIFH